MVSSISSTTTVHTEPEYIPAAPLTETQRKTHYTAALIFFSLSALCSIGASLGAPVLVLPAMLFGFATVIALLASLPAPRGVSVTTTRCYSPPLARTTFYTPAYTPAYTPMPSYGGYAVVRDEAPYYTAPSTFSVPVPPPSRPARAPAPSGFSGSFGGFAAVDRDSSSRMPPRSHGGSVAVPTRR